jgi:hypothetical protein
VVATAEDFGGELAAVFLPPADLDDVFFSLEGGVDRVRGFAAVFATGARSELAGLFSGFLAGFFSGFFSSSFLRVTITGVLLTHSLASHGREYIALWQCEQTHCKN